MGFDVVKLFGVFYIFLFIKLFGMFLFDFSMVFLEDLGVVFVLGSLFLKYGEGYVRLFFVYLLDMLREGLDCLELFVLKKWELMQMINNGV